MNGIYISLYGATWLCLMAQSSSLELPFAKEVLSLGSTGVMIGLLIVVRRFDTEIGREEQALLEAVADFASTSLVNARLFRALEQSAEAARESEKRQNAALESMRAAVAKELQAAGYPLNLVLTEMPGSLNNEQKQALLSVQDAINRLARASEKSLTQPKNPEA